MSFLTALLDYTGTRNQARNAQEQNAYENALQSRQLGIEEQQARTQDQLSQAQLAQYNQALQQAGRNRQFEAGLQLPKGWATMQPDQRIAYLTNRYNAAQRAGDTDIANSTLGEMNSLELGAERLANANYTNQGKLPLAQAQAQEATARAGYYRNVLGVDLQKAKMQLQAAQGHDATRVQTAQIAASAAMQRAGLSAETQMEGRILAGYFALQGKNASDATQMAIHAAEQANKYGQQQALLSGNAPPPLVTPQQELQTQQPISLTVNGGGGGDGGLGVLGPLILQAVLKNNPGLKLPPVKGGVTNNNNAGRPSIQQQIQAAHAHGVTDPNVIRKELLSAGYPQAEVDKALHIGPQKGSGWGTL